MGQGRLGRSASLETCLGEKEWETIKCVSAVYRQLQREVFTNECCVYKGVYVDEGKRRGRKVMRNEVKGGLEVEDLASDFVRGLVRAKLDFELEPVPTPLESMDSSVHDCPVEFRRTGRCELVVT